MFAVLKEVANPVGFDHGASLSRRPAKDVYPNLRTLLPLCAAAFPNQREPVRAPSPWISRMFVALPIVHGKSRVLAALVLKQASCLAILLQEFAVDLPSEMSVLFIGAK
jgi:hypothetical protein